MSRRSVVALAAVLLLCLAPGAAGSGPPTLAGTDSLAWTDLAWTAPANATPEGWTLYRVSDSGLQDEAFTFPAGATGYRDLLTPAPGDRFTYTVTYTEGGQESAESGPHVRQAPCVLSDPPCIIAFVCRFLTSGPPFLPGATTGQVC